MTDLDTAQEPVALRWSALSRASKAVPIIGVALLLVAIAIVAIAIWRGRVSALDEARHGIGKLGIAIAEQTSRSIQAVDIALDGISAGIMFAGIDTPERFRTDLGGLAQHQDLRRRHLMLPQVDAFTMIGADGKLVNFSRQWPVPVTDLSDRDYFRILQTQDRIGVLITQPMQNRGNGGWTAYLVRRVNSPSGQFLGLVLGAVDLSYFRDFYRALTVGAGTTVTLLRSDGTVLTSFPETARVGERLPAGSPWHAMVARRQQDAFQTEGVLAPGLRLVSVHPLGDYPLVVNVSLSEWDTLAAWRWTAAAAAIGTGCAVVCMLLLLWALTLQLGRLEAATQSVRNQTARLLASQRDLAEKSTALETTLEHMNQGIMMVDGNRSVAICNVKAVEMLGLPPDLVGRRPSLDELAVYQPDVLGAVSCATRAGVAFERRLPDGRILEIQTIPMAAGGTVETFTDITDRRVAEDRIRYFAHHDNLTKLVNRVVFQDRLKQAIDLADRSGRRVAVLYLDLDGFKQVNDTLGHAAGDELLVEVAIRLRSGARESDTVARMGGDEFAIIQPVLEQPDASAVLAERLIAMVAQPFDIEGARCDVGVSIGIAHYPDDATTASELLVNADKALYRAKAAGRRTYRAFAEHRAGGLHPYPASGDAGRPP